MRKRFTNSAGDTRDTYYVRDAQGNILATYVHDHTTNELRWREQHLYGSSRLGLWLADKRVGAGAPGDIDNCEYTENISTEGFENGMGIWENDPGTVPYATQVERLYNNDYRCNGIRSLRIKGSSTGARTQALDLTDYTSLRVDFCYTTNIETAGDKFHLQISLDDGATYVTVDTYEYGVDFDSPLIVNGDPVQFNGQTIIDEAFTATTRLRFVADLANNLFTTYFVLDDVVVDACESAPPASSCADGIQNGDETGVDCGGSSCPECYEYTASDFTVSAELDYEDFPSSINWEDTWENESGVSIIYNAANSCESTINQPRAASLPINASLRSTAILDLSSADDIMISFCYNHNINVNGDYFGLEISHDGGTTYSPIRNWVHGDDFNSGQSDLAGTAIIPGPFTTNSRLRFFHPGTNQTSGVGVYLDNIRVEAGTLNLCSDGIQNGDEEGIDCGGSQCDDCPETFVRGDKRYELTNHLGNVMAVISDRRFSLTGDEEDPQYRAYTINASEYYPFGLEMEGRKFNFGDYRFGFNGKEADSDGELGTQTSYTTFFRQYNPAIGRWLTSDPRVNYSVSPYASRENNPILYSDPLGDTTRVYSLDGILQNSIDDYLPNEEHFLSEEAISNLDNLKKEGGSVIEQAIQARLNSDYFIGSDTRRDLESLSDRGISDNAEAYGIGLLSGGSRQIRVLDLSDDFPIGPGLVKCDHCRNGASVNMSVGYSQSLANEYPNLRIEIHTHGYYSAVARMGGIGVSRKMHDNVKLAYPSYKADYNGTTLERYSSLKIGVIATPHGYSVFPVGGISYETDYLPLNFGQIYDYNGNLIHLVPKR